MEGSRQNPLSNRSLHPKVCYTIDFVIRNLAKVLHELHVARASLLMATGLGSTWVGKGSLFCLAWLANRAAEAMSSIEDMFCDIMWLVSIVNDELWYKQMLRRIELLVF